MPIQQQAHAFARSGPDSSSESGPGRAKVCAGRGSAPTTQGQLYTGLGTDPVAVPTKSNVCVIASV